MCVSKKKMSYFMGMKKAEGKKKIKLMIVS